MKVRLVETIDDFEFPEDLDAATAVEASSVDESKSTQETPPSTQENGIAGLLIDAISDEWEAIKQYNDLLVMLREEEMEEMIPIIEDIVNEENTHVGQLEKLLSTVSSNVSSIDDGEDEAEEQLSDAETAGRGTVRDFGSKSTQGITEGFPSLYDDCTISPAQADDDFDFNF